MSTVTLVLPTLHPAQRRILERRERFAVIASGRRFGKTTLAVDLAVRAGLAGDPVGWFAPTYHLLAEAWRELKHRLGPVAARVSEQEHRLELVTGGVVECWSLDGPDPARGRRYARVVLDEASIVRDLEPRFNEAIRPTLTDLAGDALILGTPKGMNGFWRLHQRGLAGEPDWSSHAGPTADNPHIDPQEIADARRDLPAQAFAQEYEAAFVADGAVVLRGVAEAMTATPRDRRQDGHAYAFGVDWGQLGDFTVVSVLDVGELAQVWADRFNQIDYHVQAGRLAILAERFRPTLIVAERNAIGLPLLEQLHRLNLPVWGWEATNATVAAGVQSLALGLERRQLRLLPESHPVGRVQRDELLAYAARRTPTGLLAYGAPEGMHDDCVRALMLSWLGALAPDGRPRSRDFRVEAG